MTTDNHAPRWRNFLIWSAVGALIYIAAMLAVLMLLPAPDTLPKPEAAAAKMVLVGIVSAALVGLSMRNSTVNGRNMRNLFVSSAVAVAIVILIKSGLRAFAGLTALGTMSASGTIALVLGLTLLALALLGFVLVAAAHMRRSFLSADRVEALRERGRAQVYSWISVAAMGLTLVLLSLAGPGGALSPTIALVAAAVLLAIVAVLTAAMWPLMDELAHTMSRETGNAAFYLVMVIGGGWAVLAHLGFVPAPAPLDWLTMFTLIMFAASFIAVGRRGLLQSH